VTKLHLLLATLSCCLILSGCNSSDDSDSQSDKTKKDSFSFTASGSSFGITYKKQYDGYSQLDLVDSLTRETSNSTYAKTMVSHNYSATYTINCSPVISFSSTDFTCSGTYTGGLTGGTYDINAFTLSVNSGETKYFKTAYGLSETYDDVVYAKLTTNGISAY